MAMTNLASLSAEFLDTLSSKLSENRFSSQIISFLDGIPIDRYKDAPSSLNCLSKLCPRDITRRHITVYWSICDFVVKVGFLSKHSVSYSTLVLALERSRELFALSNQLQCAAAVSRSPFPALLEESSTPFRTANSTNWKELLANEIFGNAHWQYAKIVDVVQLMCRDLEDRCMTVERPLKDAESTIKKLQRIVEDTSRSHSILREECEELRRELKDKQGEVGVIAHELRCAKMEIEGCQREWRDRISEKEKILAESERETAAWREREKNLVATLEFQVESLKNMHEQLAEAQSLVRCQNGSSANLEIGKMQDQQILLRAESALNFKALQANNEEIITNLVDQNQDKELQVSY